MEDIKSEIKKSLERLDYYERLANEKQDAWDDDPFNPDREAAADEAYDIQYREFVHAVHMIVRFSGIDESVARTMVAKNRERLVAIVAQ